MVKKLSSFALILLNIVHPTHEDTTILRSHVLMMFDTSNSEVETLKDTFWKRMDYLPGQLAGDDFDEIELSLPVFAWRWNVKTLVLS